MDVFLLNQDEFSFDLKREDVESWDSFGLVSLVVGIEDVFGCKIKGEEAVGVKTVRDVVKMLEKKGVLFNE